MLKSNDLNVLGMGLEPCYENPVTGYSRDEFFSTMQEDTGTPVSCITPTQEFKNFMGMALLHLYHTGAFQA
jgi:uncharacterized protein (DUF2237 family)